MHKAIITAVVIMIVFTLSAVVVMDTRAEKKTIISQQVGTSTTVANEPSASEDVNKGYLESTSSPASITASEPMPATTTRPTPKPAVPAVKGETQTTAKTERVTPTPKNHTIQMLDYAYQPKQLTIKKGDSVTWTNYDMASHTITSKGGNELASDYLKKGELYTHTFTSTGTFPYYCEPHPYMTAVVIVE